MKEDNTLGFYKLEIFITQQFWATKHSYLLSDVTIDVFLALCFEESLTDYKI